MLSVVAQMEDRPHIVFVVGEAEYRSELTMPALAQVLSSNYGFQTTVLIDSELEGEQTTSIEGLDTLSSADLVILYLRFRQLPDAQLAKIQVYIDSGRPIVAFRTTTHAFAYEGEDLRAKQWDNFGARELGAPWIYHYGHDASTDAKTVGEHPILNGVSTEFHVRSWTYHVRPDYPPKSANILVYGRPVFPDGSRGDEETFNADYLDVYALWWWTGFYNDNGTPSRFRQPQLSTVGDQWCPLDVGARITGSTVSRLGAD